MKILNKILFSGAIFTAAFLSGCSDVMMIILQERQAMQAA